MNKEYFERLVKRISPTLKKISYKLDGKYTIVDDDDLYQESLVYLWEKSQKNELYDKTDSYMLQGCYYHLKNYLRKKELKADSVSLNVTFYGEEHEIGDNIPDKEEHETDKSLGNKFVLSGEEEKRLNDREKEILRLYSEGMTVREIGRRLGVSHVMIVKIKKRIKSKCAHNIPVVIARSSCLTG